MTKLKLQQEWIFIFVLYILQIIYLRIKYNIYNDPLLQVFNICTNHILITDFRSDTARIKMEVKLCANTLLSYSLQCTSRTVNYVITYNEVPTWIVLNDSNRMLCILKHICASDYPLWVVCVKESVSESRRFRTTHFNTSHKRGSFCFMWISILLHPITLVLYVSYK